MPIESFRHKGLRPFFEEDDSSKVPSHPAERAGVRNILGALDTATSISDMQQFPAWAVHPLTGDKKGLWSAKVTKNYRITFGFRDGKAFDVDLEDYH